MIKHTSSRFTLLARLGTASLMAAGLVAGGVAAPASAHSRGQLEYVALGDSYAAGVGAGKYYNQRCLRSWLSYPERLDQHKAIDLKKNKSCTGATTADVEKQARVLNKRTDLVTVTVGGNNFDYGGTINVCLTGSEVDCANAMRTVLTYISTELSTDLDEAYDEIRDEAHNAHVVVMGYPLLFSPEFETPGGATGAAAALNQATKVFNSVIAATAAENGFQYVEVTDEFAGHGIGSADPWIHAEGPAALHPTAEGYKKGYAQAFKSDVRIDKLRWIFARR